MQFVLQCQCPRKCQSCQFGIRNCKFSKMSPINTTQICATFANTHTHPHTQREREGEACQVGCRELSEQQLPEMSVWAKWQPAGAANVARAFELNENVVDGSIQFTFAIKLTPNRHFWFSLCISDFTPCPPSFSLLPRGNLAGHDMTYNASD